MDTVHLAIQYKEKAKGIIVGLDLSGDPKVSIKTTVLLMDKKSISICNFLLHQQYCS